MTIRTEGQIRDEIKSLLEKREEQKKRKGYLGYFDDRIEAFNWVLAECNQCGRKIGKDSIMYKSDSGVCLNCIRSNTKPKDRW